MIESINLNLQIAVICVTPGEPIVVFGSSPTITAGLVQSLVSAIRPLR